MSQAGMSAALPGQGIAKSGKARGPKTIGVPCGDDLGFKIEVLFRLEVRKLNFLDFYPLCVFCALVEAQGLLCKNNAKEINLVDDGACDRH